ncbi:MAG: site-specific integrase [Rhodoferax sp.]
MTASLPKINVVVDRFTDAVAALPPLPRVIHYEDDYDEKVRSVKVDECVDSVTLHVSGSKQTLWFTRFDERIRTLIRIYFLNSIQEKAPASVFTYFSLLTGIVAEDIETSALCEPNRFRNGWLGLTAKYSSGELLALKGLLAFLCNVRFGPWTPLHAEFISRALPVQGRDNYSTVRSGDAFLTIEEEANLVRWMDMAALQAQNMDKATSELACLVVCSYQFGMRPKQLGMARKRECSVRISPEDNSAIVHLTFRMVKQRDAALSGLLLHRKVKREWAPLFVTLMNHKELDTSDSFLFGFSSRMSLSNALIGTLAEILPESGRRVAYDLRHSMAQRLVDSGASHEELAAAMGHARLESGLVYFRATANQAELVNKALGISDTYQAVAKIAANKFITPDDLAALKGDQQVAGVPHGIPIAGIGGCTTGQSSCPYNPVTACYGCPKFMPVRDLALHEQVLDEFRGIVHFYQDIGRGETHSPAYLQLQRTISEVQGVIRELRGANEE